MDTQDQKQICQMLQLSNQDNFREFGDLLKRIGIRFFHYCENYNDNKRVSLTTNPRWVEFFYTTSLIQQGYFHQHPSEYQSEIKSWENTPEQIEFYNAREQFGVTNNGVTLIKKKLESTVFYHFTVFEEGDINIFSANNAVNLHRLISAFHNQNKELITELRKRTVEVPYTLTKSNDQTTIDIPKTFNKRFCLILPQKDAYLTHTELRVLAYLISGLATKQIANLVNISVKTADNHIVNIKQKIGLYKNTEIVRVLHEMNYGAQLLLQLSQN